MLAWTNTITSTLSVIRSWLKASPANRTKVCGAALEGPQKIWAAVGRKGPRSITPTICRRLRGRAGTAWRAVRREPDAKDVLLVEARCVRAAESTAISRAIEGRLSKTPSIWTAVDVVRRYERSGVRVPARSSRSRHVDDRRGDRPSR